MDRNIIIYGCKLYYTLKNGHNNYKTSFVTIYAQILIILCAEHQVINV